MAITDFEPNEAAAIVLDYKLSDSLNEGQIQQISNDMLIDKIVKNIPAMQAPLYHINQLLFKAYNGKFPNAKATVMEFSVMPSKEDATKKLTKENVLKLFSGLSDRNIIKRLLMTRCIKMPLPRS
jgi:vesicle coat complex subunit